MRRRHRRLDKRRGCDGLRRSNWLKFSCEARVAVWAALADRRCFFAVHTARARGLPTWNEVGKQMGARGGWAKKRARRSERAAELGVERGRKWPGAGR